MPEITIVVPVHDDASHLAELCDRLFNAFAGREVEIVLVDDASRDGSADEIGRLAAHDPRIVGLQLPQGRGQTMAWLAGFAVASSPVVVTVDADLDTMPEDVPSVVAAVEAGAQVAQGARRGGRAWVRGIPSAGFNWWFRRLGLPYSDIGSGLVAMRADVAASLSSAPADAVSYRIKVRLAELAPDLQEVSVRRGPPAPSSYHPLTLFEAGIDAAVVAGSRVRRRAPAVAVGSFALALVGVAIGGAPGRRAAPVAASIGVAAAGIGLLVARSVRRAEARAQVQAGRAGGPVRRLGAHGGQRSGA